MRLTWRMKRLTIFTKLVLAFLIVISPLYVLGTFMNDKGVQIIRTDISRSLKQKVEYYLMSLETEIERITVLQREFMNDEDLQALSMLSERMSTYERLATMNRLQARLGLIKESSPYISQANVYIPPVARVISSDRAVSHLEREQLEQLKQGVLQSEPPFIANDDHLYIREYYPSAYNLATRDPVFVLEAEVSIPALTNFLQQLPGYDRGGAVMLNGQAPVVHETDRPAFQQIWQELQTYWAEDARGGGTGTHSERISLKDGVYLTVYVFSQKLNSFLIVYVPEDEVMGPIQKYRVYLWMISVVSVIVIVIFAYWIYRIIHRPLRKLVGAFRKVESGIMQVEIKHNSADEFHYLYEKFNAMVGHLNKLIYEVYEQKIHLQQAELKQLQSQIDPHFLYNSFYLLYRMTKANDNENATRFTKFLGDYFQYITRNGKEEVRLQEELHHAKAYTEIQSIRFQGRIQVEFEENPELCRDITVPRLILQPVIENAYKHAFDHDLDHCRLHLRMKEGMSEEGTPLLFLIVEDNGKGMSDQELREWQRLLKEEVQGKEVTGILNVHRRLRLKYGSVAGIRIEKGQTAGVTVTITVPMEGGHKEC